MWSAFARGWDQPDRDSRSSIDAKHEGPASTFTLAMSWSLGSWAGRMVPARRTCWACSMRRASRSDAPQETNRCSGAGLDRSAIALSPRRSTGSIGASSAGQFCPIATLRSCYLGIKPYAYQWKGAEFLARTGRALLADEMGLSKTVQAILAAAAMRSASRPARGVTIVCPASLRGGWEEEIHRCLGECAVLLEGISEERARTIASRPASLVTHYEQVLRDHRHHSNHPPDLLIIDEVQQAKGLWTRTARVLKSIRARYVFALTGTPLENRLEEAYAIAQLIDQRLLPPLWMLDRDHFVREPNGRRVVLYRGLGALRSQLAPAFLRRRKEDVALDLPERLRATAMLPMHEAVVPTYEDVLAQVARIASKKVLLPADLERMQRLLVIARRCCNGPHMLGHEVEDRKVPKLGELEQVLRDLCLGEGRKAVVFSEWTDMTDRAEALCRRLRLPVFHLHGGVSVRSRPALLRGFTDQKGPAVFVSTDAGGVGAQSPD